MLASRTYLDVLYARYLKDPNSVDEESRTFFETWGGEEEFDPHARLPVVDDGTMADLLEGTVPVPRQKSPKVDVTERVRTLATTYARYGYTLYAQDPLALHPAREVAHIFDLKSHGLHPEDRLQVDDDAKFWGMHADTVGDFVAQLRQRVSGTMGVEYAHMDPRTAAFQWIEEQVLTGKVDVPLKAQERREGLRYLAKSTGLEWTIAKHYPVEKRFGLDGIDSLIPMLHLLIERERARGVHYVAIAMAHRGRLNALANIVQKKATIIFNEFSKDTLSPMGGSSGDVKYHLGWREHVTGFSADLLNNPSHLESIDPILSGYVRGLQDARKTRREQIMGIMIHGDGALSGQGVVAETLNLWNLPAYSTEGMVHVMMNNQIAYTAELNQYTSGNLATDIARGYNMPILHVNATDVDAVLKAAKLASLYRTHFAQDIFLDLVGYRLHGHNEGDEPTYTNPVMYQAVVKQRPIYEQYDERLKREGVVGPDTDYLAEEMAGYERAYGAKPKEVEEDLKATPPMRHPPAWKLKTPSAKGLQEIGREMLELPEGFALNPKLKRLFKNRSKAYADGKGLDWGGCETLGYAELLKSGVSIRLMGEDTPRGTFTHRHARFWDYKTGAVYSPMDRFVQPGATWTVENSPVSEFATMGFEYGYALARPRALVIWEAQFGDFANGAQIIIDQYLSSAGVKWDEHVGLVLYLPHGAEGMGSEHSSARLERFLQLCAEDNLYVVTPTEPANLYLFVRRQLQEERPRPLVVMTPKSLLRLPESFSSIQDMRATAPRLLVDDDTVKSGAVRKVILCSGRVYYAALKARGERKDIALVRIEQAYPWPEKAVLAILEKYGTKVSYVWLQEEPRNSGMWSYVCCLWREHPKLSKIDLRYVGRPSSASPAEGIHWRYEKAQKALMKEALA